MSVVALGVSVDNYVREERVSKGTVREQIVAFQKANKIKASFVPVNAYNLAKGGSIMARIIEENADKAPSELIKTDNIMLSREVTAMFRSGEINWSTLLDFEIVMHQKVNDEGIEEDDPYPLIVKPTAGINEEKFAQFKASADTEVTSVYQQEELDLMARLSL